MYRSALPSILFLAGLALHSEGPVQSYKLMPQNRWGNKALCEVHNYPTLAGLAKIQGDVISALVITKDGKVTKFKALIGPPQLKETAEYRCSLIKFEVTPEDGEGPWIFFVTAHFDLDSKTITFSPTPQDKIPNGFLNKSSK